MKIFILISLIFAIFLTFSNCAPFPQQETPQEPPPAQQQKPSRNSYFQNIHEEFRKQQELFEKEMKAQEEAFEKIFGPLMSSGFSDFFGGGFRMKRSADDSKSSESNEEAFEMIIGC